MQKNKLNEFIRLFSELQSVGRYMSMEIEYNEIASRISDKLHRIESDKSLLFDVLAEVEDAFFNDTNMMDLVVERIIRLFYDISQYFAAVPNDKYQRVCKNYILEYKGTWDINKAEKYLLYCHLLFSKFEIEFDTKCLDLGFDIVLIQNRTNLKVFDISQNRRIKYYPGIEKRIESIHNSKKTDIEILSEINGSFVFLNAGLNNFRDDTACATDKRLAFKTVEMLNYMVVPYKLLWRYNKRIEYMIRYESERKISGFKIGIDLQTLIDIIIKYKQIEKEFGKYLVEAIKKTFPIVTQHPELLFGISKYDMLPGQGLFDGLNAIIGRYFELIKHYGLYIAEDNFGITDLKDEAKKHNCDRYSSTVGDNVAKKIFQSLVNGKYIDAETDESHFLYWIGVTQSNAENPKQIKWIKSQRLLARFIDTLYGDSGSNHWKISQNVFLINGKSPNIFTMKKEISEVNAEIKDPPKGYRDLDEILKM